MELIRQQAFETDRKMLKGGLHCHTTRSDGLETPEEVIRMHYENGYDFMTITDHRIYNYKNYSPEIPMTILPGTEMTNILENNRGERIFDHVCLGTTKELGNGMEQDEELPVTHFKSASEYQHVLDAMHAKKNITYLAHPHRSATPPAFIADLKDNFAIEIWNSGGAIENEMDCDAEYWDELLDMGKRVYGVAADDGHFYYHHCKGWVMVNAENSIPAILEALQNGAFYSSCGPEIYDFYVEDGKAVVKCSDVARIRLHSMKHATEVIKRKEGPLTEGEFPVREGAYNYVRASVVDSEGRKAWTNPIFLT